jgi:hypothetical protein
MSSSRARRRAQAAVGAFAVLAISVLAGCSTQDDIASRQATVASRGAEVMPFDLEATTHTFTKIDVGGRQVVTANDPSDRTQVDLIRQHLQTERTNFANGDFSDPARIHGMDMPGVSELSAGHTRVTVTYTERPDGAELTYATDDATLIDAIHSWFDRQVMDHGDHARSG